METEIINIKGKDYLIKDGKAFEVVKADVKQDIIKEVKVKKIKYSDIKKVLTEMTPKQVINMFGKVNKENPYKIKTSKFFTKYKVFTDKGIEAKGNYIPTYIKSGIIINKQMEASRLSKQARKDIYNTCKQLNFDKIKKYQKDYDDATTEAETKIKREKQIKHLADENLRLNTIIKGI
jgi:hypothetical protein